MDDLKNKIDITRLPAHVSVIMDGNGRWAQERGYDRIFGHHQGIESVRVITETASELGIKYLSLYTFSTENWNRPQSEVDALMELLVFTIEKETELLNRNNVRLAAIGDINRLPQKAAEKLYQSIEITSSNTGLCLILALSYSSRWEIVNATRNIARMVKEGEIQIEQVDESFFSGQLTTVQIPDPDLMIRTSGEQRVSNFLLWQMAYAELYFTETMWPAFRENEFYQAIYDYQQRERRFGK